MTDVDLHQPSKMQEVTRFLGKATPPPLEWEAWLRDVGKGGNLVLAQALVNHSKRVVSLDRTPVEVSEASEGNRKFLLVGFGALFIDVNRTRGRKPLLVLCGDSSGTYLPPCYFCI